MDTVDPDARLTLDRDLFARLLGGYRHLASLQVQNDYDVKTDIPSREARKWRRCMRAAKPSSEAKRRSRCYETIR